MTPFVGKALSDTQAAVVQRIMQAALAAADPRAAVRRALILSGQALEVGASAPGQRLDLNTFRRVRVVGCGKAAQAMALGLLDVFGDRVQNGLLITKHIDPQSGLPERIRVLPGGHPVPSAQGLTSAQAMVEFLSNSSEQDLVFCLISGGGSALMTLPVPGISLDDMQALTRLLLASGADIFEINTLRKHLDQVKGGKLARLATPARLVTLVLSDVIGSPLDVIASGPTVPDTSTYADGLAILNKYNLLERVPTSIRAVLEQGAAGALPETVKPGDPALAGSIHHLVASNPQAAEAALVQARAEGFNALLLTSFLQGEAAQVGTVLANILQQIHATGQPLPRPACLLAGGETTVTIRGSGKGGRNQELALGAAFALAGLPNVALVTFGTDGEDGPTDAAGAVVTGQTLARARAAGLDPLAYLKNNDSYAFFQSLGDLLVTGPTGTNVNDLAFLLAF